MGKYDNVMMNTAELFAAESYCKILQVGAVAVRDGRILLTGYNGTISGTDNCCEEDIECDCYEGLSGTMRPCTKCKGTGVIRRTKPSTIHAERNIIFYAAREGISLKDATMYVTHAPCIGCAQAMAAVGIIEVVFKNYYKSTDGIEYLQSLNIITRKM